MLFDTCVSNIKMITFFLSRRYCWSQFLSQNEMSRRWYFGFSTCSDAFFNRIKTKTLWTRFFCEQIDTTRRDVFEAKTLPNSSLMNRQPVHTENMLAVTQTQSLRFDFHEENAIETKKHTQSIREGEKIGWRWGKKCGFVNNAKKMREEVKKKSLHWTLLGWLFVSVIRPNRFSFIHSFDAITRRLHAIE